MNFYNLSDDIHVPGRWHLGEVFDQTSNVQLELRHGKPAPNGIALWAEITHAGLALDFFLTSFAVPVCATNLARAIASKAGEDIQRLPLKIEGYKGFEVINSVRIIKCLDENQSEFVKWTEKDHRADLAGQYRMVTRLKINSVEIPADAHIFRIEGWRIALIVSEHVKSAMQIAGCRGAKFEEVT